MTTHADEYQRAMEADLGDGSWINGTPGNIVARNCFPALFPMRNSARLLMLPSHHNNGRYVEPNAVGALFYSMI
ncbi:MAG: hypothetical protein ACYC0C_13445 [Devosia sp.]